MSIWAKESWLGALVRHHPGALPMPWPLWRQPMDSCAIDEQLAPGPLISRVAFRNYRSIAACDVALSQLCFLVGPNGSGKSNFLDGLRFVADALRSSLDHAMRDRGGIKEVRRRSSGHPNHFGIRLDVDLPSCRATFAFEVGARSQGGYSVQREECRIVRRHAVSVTDYYRVENGTVAAMSMEHGPPAAEDRLYLVNVSGLPAFRPVYDALSSMGFYSLNPEEIRELQPPDPGELLARDGRNLASVLAVVASKSPDVKARIEEYLAKVVPGVSAVDAKPIGHKETLEFRQVVRGSPYPWRFLASNMSDGTLRALGVLVALFQWNGKEGRRLIGIEEPEIALHPAAAGVLTDALRDASRHVQVLVTSHSPDLLDNDDIPNGSLLAVVSEDGETRVGPLDRVGRSALHDHLYTAGELLRMDQLRPDPELSQPHQLDLFAGEI